MSAAKAKEREVKRRLSREREVKRAKQQLRCVCCLCLRVCLFAGLPGCMCVSVCVRVHVQKEQVRN